MGCICITAISWVICRKDVYKRQIVGGVPARQIRKRFSEDTISSLLDIRWWDWSEKKMCIRDRPHIRLNWNQVEKRIKELIRLDRYLNPKEKEIYPQWLEKQEEMCIRDSCRSVTERKSKSFLQGRGLNTPPFSIIQGGQIKWQN